MNLTPYVESVRTGVSDAAALADEHTRQVAQRLGSAIDASTRLALIDVLCDAADAISADLAPGSVVVSMSGSEPQFIVSLPRPAAEPTMLLPAESPSESEESPEPDDEPVARISLRLPASVKARVDDMAARDQISTNAWLLRAVMDALGTRRGSDMPPPPQAPAPPGLGVHGPFGPHGVFGANGPFGPGGVFGARPEQPDHRKNRGSVRGWAR